MARRVYPPKIEDELSHIRRLLAGMCENQKTIQQTLETIMSAISDFKVKMDAHNDAIDAAVTGLQGDIKFLNDTIAKLQASPGTLSAEDQASLDAVEARGKTIADKLTALDAQTPPVVPAG